LRIAIVTPAPAGSRHGNRHTAQRWASHLRALGHRASILTQWRRGEFDALIALHARRSHGSIAAWKKAHPAKPLVVVLTGTDLYRDIRSDREARLSLEMADRLVVLQQEGLKELAPRLRRKAAVIHQSVPAVRRLSPSRQHFLVTVIGHLREEKDPFCAARALRRLEGELRLVQLGKALSEDMAKAARRFMKEDGRYRWLGELPRPGALRWLARSHAMVISSRMEGGAHVVSEAIAAGVPVLASRIPGNVGLLGARYPGYYPVGSDKALAKLIARARGDEDFLHVLEKAVKARRPLTWPDAERSALRALLSEIRDRPRFSHASDRKHRAASSRA
jgi:putative glycosyltransferase (TIGR04348 family)